MLSACGATRRQLLRLLACVGCLAASQCLTEEAAPHCVRSTGSSLLQLNRAPLSKTWQDEADEATRALHAETGSTKSATTTTATTTTTTTTPVPLSAVRNCYLEPLVEGAGCKLLKVYQGNKDFGLNEFGQETSGRQACLQKMRAAKGDSFVHSVGRCEVWLCGTKARLRNSAGAGGGLSSEPNAVALRSKFGDYLAAHSNGDVDAKSEGAFVPESLFIVLKGSPVTSGKVALKASNGLFVKAEPLGRVSAMSAVRDTWEEFEMVETGKKDEVALRSFHNLYVTADSDGSVHADSTKQGPRTIFTLVNRSEAAYHGAKKAGPKKGTLEKTAVFSKLCEYQPGRGGEHGKELRSPVFVKLWEWNYPDIARECEEYLAPNGIDAVQISPVGEHVLGYQWWTKYQPVSMGLDSRSGTEEELKDMVARCRAVGVDVIVDILMNHMASPCKEAKSIDSGMACTGWGGSKYGNRQLSGARDWDAATPAMFHHKPGNASAPMCSVGPQTGWLCPDDDCVPCDMYGLPDWDTAQQRVLHMHALHLEELYSIGITMLRIDAAIYHRVWELASMLNRVPWDLIYSEWWGEFPPEDRTEYVGNYRDVAYRWHVTDVLASKNATEFPELLKLHDGVFGITEDMAVYPMAYHDGRSKQADKSVATYKNGLEYHQEQKFFLAWPFGIKVLIWGGYGWTDEQEGPPGCEKGSDRCTPEPVFDSHGKAACMATPTESPLPMPEATQRSWVCEHRWQGVAGMIHFRKACRGLPMSKTWQEGDSSGVSLGRVAFRLSGSSDTDGPACFAALERGYNEVSKPSWGHLGKWNLEGMEIGLPEGRYCDLSSLFTQKDWDRKDCPRKIVVGSGGRILSGHVPDGDIVAIHTGARLD